MEPPRALSVRHMISVVSIVVAGTLCGAISCDQSDDNANPPESTNGGGPATSAPRIPGTPSPKHPSTLLAARAWKMIHAGALVIDVRTPEEFASGHLMSAVNIPFDAIDSRLSEIGDDLARPIVVYCRSGRRSGIAYSRLKDNGYTNVLNAGGYSDLRRAKTR